MLGKGAQSVIHKGTWQGKPCALKRLQDMDYVLEAFLLVSIKHENIISAYGIDGTASGGLKIALELADCDLTCYLEENNLDEEERLALFNSLLCAVSYLHKNGIYHGDIKPKNCLVLDGKLKLADLGSAKVRRGRSKLSTPAVSSPQMLNKTDQDHAKSDIWAVGVTFYYILYGENLFDAQSMSEFRALMNKFLLQPRTFLLERGVEEEHVDTMLLMLQAREEDRILPTFVEKHIYPPLFRKRSLSLPEVPLPLQGIFSKIELEEDIKHNAINLYNSLPLEMQEGDFARACVSLCLRLLGPLPRWFKISGSYYGSLWRRKEERIVLYKQGAIFSQLPM